MNTQIYLMLFQCIICLFQSALWNVCHYEQRYNDVSAAFLPHKENTLRCQQWNGHSAINNATYVWISAAAKAKLNTWIKFALVGNTQSLFVSVCEQACWDGRSTGRFKRIPPTACLWCGASSRSWRRCAASPLTFLTAVTADSVYLRCWLASVVWKNVTVQAEKWESRKDIIPLLHTLMYAIIQVPSSLYKCD